MKKLKLTTTIIIFIIALAIGCYFLYYPISLDIDRAEIKYAKIIYHGDGADKKIEKQEELNILTDLLNQLSFKRHIDMNHEDPKSGITIIELYNDADECIDTVSFYTWAYRGGEFEGKERKDGIYLKVKENKAYSDFCDFCLNIFKQEKDKVALRRIEISEVEGISQQEAEALCLPVLGDRDDTTGFTVSYRCIGAVEKDNRQYYVIDVSWLVDSSHWSHIGNLFVSADGKEIYDGMVNQSEYIFEDILWSK